jgi:hypothetical protein
LRIAAGQQFAALQQVFHVTPIDVLIRARAVREIERPSLPPLKHFQVSGGVRASSRSQNGPKTRIRFRFISSDCANPLVLDEVPDFMRERETRRQ